MLLLHVIIISFFLYSIVYIIVSYGALFHIMIYYDILLLHIVKHVSVAYIYIHGHMYVYIHMQDGLCESISQSCTILAYLCSMPS